jgi:2-dehydropantoate 2-reductase
MRIIVYGVGAIGGTVAAALALSGQKVVGIARGAQLDAIRDAGLVLRTPDGTARAKFPCVADPTEIAFGAEDAILLAMKTQDTIAALERLRHAGVRNQPIFCAQNGVANERFALRRFANVHGITVMMPATFLVPGEVAAQATPRHGIFDVGRYPSGSDADDARLAAALEAASVAAFVDGAVMEGKYGKLLMNLRNVIEAALGPDADLSSFARAVTDEAKAVYAAAGIAWRDVGNADPRRAALMRVAAVDGMERSGGSSTQSLARGAGSIETDYLNGEIVLLGRHHGVPTPASAYLTALGARLVRERLAPGAISSGEIAEALTAAGVSLAA